MYFLDSKSLEFPPYEATTDFGVIAIGGDLSAERLEEAYKKGIFPWFNEGEPIMWWCPDPRFVIFPKDLKVSKSMKKVLASNQFKVTYNKAFKEVIENCKSLKRKGQKGTWITEDMEEAYIKLHHKGLAKSVEVWNDNDELIGGLYGVDLGDVFCGESMFTKQSNASKAGFITLVKEGNYKLLDCQVHTNHLESLGAKEIPREEFLQYLK